MSMNLDLIVRAQTEYNYPVWTRLSHYGENDVVCVNIRVVGDSDSPVNLEEPSLFVVGFFGQDDFAPNASHGHFSFLFL